MIILGVVLVLAALAAFGFVATGSGGAETIRIEGFGLAVETPPVVLFLAGAAVLLLAEVGLWLLRTGARRHSRTRSELGRLRRVEAEVNAQQVQQAQREADARNAAVPVIVDTPFGRREQPTSTVPTLPAVAPAGPPVIDSAFGREPTGKAADAANPGPLDQPLDPAAGSRPQDSSRL